ncbi:MAG TPA: NADH-quinone oxidoreductase subunit C [Tepidisphaeraceae bacterium]|nr:NADH-quinone oxidoreductase subunit C [Tepidisphaeraceae bacterium]
MPRTITHPTLAPLKAKFPDAGLRVGEFRDMVTVIVPRERIREICLYLRDDPTLRYDMLFELNAVDYLGFPGADKLPGRFAVNYGLLNVESNQRLWLRVFLTPTQDTAPKGPASMHRDEDVVASGDPGLKVDSVYPVWPSADWMEREAYDMMGIIFVGHPDLRRLFTWNGFGSYPLRKDYPLRGVGEREDYRIVTRDSA